MLYRNRAGENRLRKKAAAWTSPAPPAGRELSLQAKRGRFHFTNWSEAEFMQ